MYWLPNTHFQRYATRTHTQRALMQFPTSYNTRFATIAMLLLDNNDQGWRQRGIGGYSLPIGKNSSVWRPK